MSVPFVTQLSPSLYGLLKSRLEEKGFEFSYPPHTIFLARSSSVSCALYSSGKLVVQGKGSQEFIEFFLEPEILLTFSCPDTQKDLRPRLGVDESGKGDFLVRCVLQGYSLPVKKFFKNFTTQEFEILNYLRILKLSH